jgi:threonylcarbamoyladenosine tRNA methylthiotransferase MtaB
MRIHVSSLGCKLNQSEMDTLAGQLAATGHQVVRAPQEADLCVFNTCAVTHVAAQKTRQALRRLHRDNPGARLVVTGCYAELTPADLQDLPGVELVAGNQAKGRLAELIRDGRTGIVSQVTEYETRDKDHVSRLTFDEPQLTLDFAPTRTRALVKIQDGCDNACSYCIIHVARGPQRSRPPEEILTEVRARLAAGHREVVLTGVHIGAYGRGREDGDPGLDLWGLVRRILAETEVPRLRLSSIEPWDLPQQAFSLWKEPRLCRHLHLPLQSGSDTVLRRMRRRTATGEFSVLIEAARAAIPDLAITTDVITGFPGETEEEFAAGLAFVEAMGFARVHVFPYSLRPGTPAAGMPDQVPPPVKKERARALRSAAAAREQAFRQRFVGRTMGVLWESLELGESGPVWSGLTDNYLRVQTASTEDLGNRETCTRLVALTEGGLRGRIEK